jgi:hypothetical protein
MKGNDMLLLGPAMRLRLFRSEKRTKGIALVVEIPIAFVENAPAPLNSIETPYEGDE